MLDINLNFAIICIMSGCVFKLLTLKMLKTWTSFKCLRLSLTFQFPGICSGWQQHWTTKQTQLTFSGYCLWECTWAHCLCPAIVQNTYYCWNETIFYHTYHYSTKRTRSYVVTAKNSKFRDDVSFHASSVHVLPICSPSLSDRQDSDQPIHVGSKYQTFLLNHS